MKPNHEDNTVSSPSSNLFVLLGNISLWWTCSFSLQQCLHCAPLFASAKSAAGKDKYHFSHLLEKILLIIIYLKSIHYHGSGSVFAYSRLSHMLYNGSVSRGHPCSVSTSILSFLGTLREIPKSWYSSLCHGATSVRPLAASCSGTIHPYWFPTPSIITSWSYISALTVDIFDGSPR